MADNGEELERIESAEIADAEGDGEMGETEGEIGGNLGMEGDMSEGVSFVAENKGNGDELVGEGADDDAEAVNDTEVSAVSDISWVEELWNKKKAEEASAEQLRKEPEADNDFEMKDESDEMMQQSSEVDQPLADLNVSNETEQAAEQEETSLVQSSERTFLEMYPHITKSSVRIPQVYMGTAFDKCSFQCYIRVSPVVYQNLTGSTIQAVFRNADTVQVQFGHRGTPRVLQLFCQKSAPLLEPLMFTTLSGNSVHFALERKRVAGWTKVVHNGKTLSVPTGFETSQAPERVKFTLKQNYFRKHLARPLYLDRDQDVKDRSLFLSNLPATPNIGLTLKVVFPLALNVDVIKVSEKQRSAVLTMKNRTMVIDHMVSMQDLRIDGHKIEMGSTTMTQMDAIKQEAEAVKYRSSSRTARPGGIASSDKTEPGQSKKQSSEEQEKPEQEKEATEEEGQQRERRIRDQREKMQLKKEKERQRVQRERLERYQPRSGERSMNMGRETLGMKYACSGFQKPQRAERWEGRGQRRRGGPPRRQGLLRTPGIQHEFTFQKQAELWRKMEMHREREFEREMEREREWEQERYEAREWEERERWEWEERERQRMEEQEERRRDRQHREELLREKERLEEMHQEAVHKLKMVEEQQRREREELQRRQHDMDMEKKRMQRQLEAERRRQQREKEEWERQSRKRSRFESMEHGAGSQQYGNPEKRRRGEGEPWGRQEGLRSDSSVPGDSSEVSVKRKLELEVARQAEELKKSLALLDKVKTDPAGAHASLREARRGQDIGHRDSASASFSKQQKPNQSFGTQQQQQPYGKDYNQAQYGSTPGQDYGEAQYGSSQGQEYGGEQYGSSHGQDYGGQFYGYGQDMSYFQQQPHRGGQTNTTTGGYNAGYGAQGQAGSQSWGTGAKDTGNWQVHGNQGAGGYNQSESYGQTTDYNHGQPKTGGYQQGGYGQLGRRGASGQGGKRRGGQAQQEERGRGQRFQRWFGNSGDNRHGDQGQQGMY